MESESGFVEIGACRFTHRTGGDGPPLLLVHAGIADSRMWEPQLPALTTSFRVIRPDLRGHGQTVKPAEAYADHEDLHRLLEHLGVDDVSIVGASNGGKAALDLCLEHPDLVSSLVLVCSALGGYECTDEWLLEMWRDAEAAFEAGDHERAARIELETWLAGPRRSLEDVRGDLVARLRAMLLRSYELDVDADERELAPPAAARLEDIRARTLVLVGADDVPDMLRIADTLATGITGARKVVVEGAAHLPNMERPQQFNELVVDFVRPS